MLIDIFKASFHFNVCISLKSSQPTPGGSFQQQSSGFGGQSSSSYQPFGGPSLYGGQYGPGSGNQQQQGYGGLPPSAGQSGQCSSINSVDLNGTATVVYHVLCEKLNNSFM